MKDWIDREYEQRLRGINIPIDQHQHAAVNARYPGCTLECCFKCGEPTGRAGRGEDSMYDENDNGPYCEECFDKIVSEYVKIKS